MFADYPDRVKPEPTPERMMALLRMVDRVNTKEALQEAITMSDVFPGAAAVFGLVYNAARELGMIHEADGSISLAVAKTEFASFPALRSYVANVALQRRNSTFYLITERFLGLNEDVLSIKNWDTMAATLLTAEHTFKEEDLLGWRWWSSFLGIGYLVGTTMIPNLAIRLADAVQRNTGLPDDERIPMADFVRWLESQCPETMKSRRERTLGLGVSNGLRLLAKQGVLEFENRMDADRWWLHNLETHHINGVTHVQVRR